MGALLWVPPADSGKGRTLPADRKKFLDAMTEFPLVRLTDPSYDSYLPSPPARALNRRSNAMLFASKRTGSLQVLEMDLKSGKSEVLTAAENLDAETLTYSADDRFALYFDGGMMRSVPTTGGRERELYQVREGWERTGPISPSGDGTAIYWVERREGKSELRRMRIGRAGADTLASQQAGIVEVTPNPRRALVVFRGEDGSLWLEGLDGSAAKRIETPAGRVLQALWSPDGNAILYLHEPAEAGQLVAIREQQVDSRADKLVAKTSQFARFARNSDATVFLGASRSKASPAVLLMLRVTKRELTLCEHRAGKPEGTSLQFSPDSQTVYFQTERGRDARSIYAMEVERLVEKTEEA
jgi:oligogalacturonide lyase